MRRFSLLIVLLTFLVLPCATAGADGIVPAPVQTPTTLKVRPPFFKTTGEQALAIARRQPAFARVLRRYPHPFVSIQVYGADQWQISIAETRSTLYLAQVSLTSDGRVLHVYSGIAAADSFARGSFDTLFEKPWVWLTFGVLFLLPFVDPRRLRRLLHLDLLVLTSFGVSYALMAQGHPESAIRLVYPPLLYLLVRMLLAGRRGARRPSGRLVPLLPTAVLLVGVIGLFGARVALNVADHQVIDIGYASVVGADRIAHKQQLYVDNVGHGDTYGPVNYISYIPFELALPFKGAWDRLPAAHAAALFFDLMTLIGLFLLGLRFRAGPEGRRLGLALAWAWAACPFTLLTVMQSSNDGLVAMLLVFTLLVLSSAPARGAVLALAVAAKFSPAALLLLIARGRKEDGPRQWLATVVACVALFAFAMAVYWPAGGFTEVWNCTLGFQLGRLPDFSLWALYGGIGWTQTVLEVVAVAIAAAVAFIPSRRGLTEIAALAAAVLVAIQLPAGHWFYFYISWFAPLVLVGLFTAYREPAVAAAALPGDADGAVPVTRAPLALAS